MANTGMLKSDQLFKGLTRPAMILGVSFPYAILNGTISLLTFVLTTKFIILAVIMPALHALGYFICFHEPLFIELFMIKLQKCNKCKNTMYHGSNSYDPT